MSSHPEPRSGRCRPTGQAVTVHEVPRIHCCLEVSGSFDPNELTTLLRTDAEIARAGQVRRNGTVREVDSWHFSTPTTSSMDWPDHLERVLDLVRPRAEEFRVFCRGHSLTAGVHLVAYMTGSTPIGSFTQVHIAELASLGCSLEVDLYCDANEDQ